MTIKHYQNIALNKGEQNTAASNNTDSEDLDTMLNKIGKRIFVDYYYIFKTDDSP